MADDLGAVIAFLELGGLIAATCACFYCHGFHSHEFD
jgi:hypothetical protein